MNGLTSQMSPLGRDEPLISEFLTTALKKLLVVAPANFKF
jgi:hypothetical protein